MMNATFLRLGSGGVAIASMVFAPLAVLANPLATMEGWVYTAKSNPAAGMTQYGLPETLVSRGGAAIGNASVEKPYLVSIYQYGAETVVSFEQMLMEQQVAMDNEQYIEILDTAAVNQASGWAVGCQVNGQADPEVVAIAGADSQISAAWRANRSTRKLEAVSPATVTCPSMN